MEKTISQDVVERIIDKLDDYDLQEDAFETACLLFEAENIDGSITYNTYEAERWICKYFSNLRDVVEEYNEVYGEGLGLLNPFTNPEGFMVQIIMFVTETIIKEEWEEGITKERLIEKLQEDFL